MKPHSKKLTRTLSLYLLCLAGLAILAACEPSSQTGTSSQNTPSAGDTTVTNLTASASGLEAKYAGVYLCQSPATTLRLEADRTGGIMIGGHASEGSWQLISNAGDAQVIIEFKPEHSGSSKFAVQEDGSLKETKYGYKFEKLPSRQ